MKSIASAPGKIILFGEHFVVHGVKAILATIDKRVTVTSEKTKEPYINIISSLAKEKIPLSSKSSEVNKAVRPFYYLASRAIKEFNYKGGIKVKIESDIPSGVGLGSSSACCVAAAASIMGLFSKLGKDEILNIAIDAEKTIFRNTSGADCTVCTYGGLIMYDKKSGFSNLKSKPDLEFVIANSQMTHSTEKIVTKVSKFKEKNSSKFLSLCNKVEKLIQRADSEMGKNDLVALGKSMKENQGYLEIIGVSNEKLREMINLSNKRSFGSKLTGAGGGGCIVALVNKSNIKETITELESKNYECFRTKIDFKGLDF